MTLYGVHDDLPDDIAKERDGEIPADDSPDPETADLSLDDDETEESDDAS